MGGALLKGWLAQGTRDVFVVEPKPSTALRRLAKANSVPLFSTIEDAPLSGVRVCVIAIKPQLLATEAVRLRAVADAGALLVSIAAGTTTATLARACGRTARIVRAMPNLPGAIGRGISGLYAAKNASAADRATAEKLLRALGDVVWVKREAMIDSVTAVSGSGPAYVFLLVEALAGAGVAEGLAAPLAMKLARATVAGAGALLDADARDADLLRREVTSPGGTTEAALSVLMNEEAFAALMKRAVAAARRRAQELNG